MNKGLVIAIDGPSGAGKSTAARLLAKRLGYIYIDTGAMYRAVGWKAVQEGIDLNDESALSSLSSRIDITITNDNENPRIYVDGMDVSGQIRTPEIGMAASEVSKSPSVRSRLLVLQRRLGEGGGVVMDGRDIGTVVFPDADLKFYLDADPAERGRRRYLELKSRGLDVDPDRITKEIIERDRQDSMRDIAPLRPAPDAVVIDSSSMSIDEVLDVMLRKCREKGAD